MTLDFSVLLEVGEHDDEGNAVLVHHSPKVLDGGLQGPLRCYEQLVVPTDRCVYVIGIDVGVVDVFVSLNQANSCVLD